MGLPLTLMNPQGREAEACMPKWSEIPWATAVTALVAIYGAALSTVNFFDQRYETRNQLLLSTKPHVDFDINTYPDEPPVGIAIRNAGPGAAIIKSLTSFVDRKTVRNADEVATTYAKLSEAEYTYYEFEPNDTMAAQEQEWLIQYRKPRKGKINEQKLEKFADFVDERLAVKVTFCSTIQEDSCWSKCSTKDGCD
jgi:hypothetical protein